MKMIDLKKDLKKRAKDEFKILKILESSFLIRLIGDDFEFEEFYCFFTEFCEVCSILLII